jgi:hypothetical protein
LRQGTDDGVQETLATNSSFATIRPVVHFGKIIEDYFAGGVSYLPPFLRELARLAHAGPAGDIQALNGAQSFFCCLAQNSRFIGYTEV